MTPEKQCITLAEFAGADPWWRCSNHSETTFEAPCCPSGVELWDGVKGPVPDYLHDLNAIHTLEQFAASQIPDFWIRYLDPGIGTLLDVVGEDNPVECATAPQRSEAILRAIGKWAKGRIVRVILYSSGLGPKITLGLKTTTIRKSARCKPGDILSHREWTGKPYRSKQRELCQSVCISVDQIHIDHSYWVTLGGKVPGLNIGERNALAQDDGFDSWPDLIDYFQKTHGLPFTGEIIRWSPESISIAKP